ncbi:FecR domain-containing protein [Chitinophaga sancti]|uniref:FecR family protein n=1 Tax=Chitinophaga sancti TaxID=1004 RepID=UPI002A751DEE|nr:FecR domain-containing protein [Chitinophaga sancti]WPQ63608.1 FecR domain-containing protein [Chitinophaga sancti]
MKITSEQVARFITNNCSPEEAEMLAAWFAEHPDDLISTPEWEEFVIQQRIPEETDAAMWQYIAQHTKRTPKVYYFRRIAAAAAMIGIIGGSVLLWKPQHQRHLQATLVDTTTVRYTLISNDKKHDQTYQLEDGTTVVLSSGSKLKHVLHFDRQQRYLQLEGKAFFDVAKDKDRPFTVEAGGLTTTALGTSFRITALKGEVHVQLITGKVVVKKASTTFKPVYLNPGQQLVFNTQQEKAVVSDNKLPSLKTAPATVAANETKGQVFHQEPLKNVFLTLQSYYHTSITFDEQQLKNMKFSGTYADTDSVADLLSVITLVNGLKLEKTATGYNITR